MKKLTFFMLINVTAAVITLLNTVSAQNNDLAFNARKPVRSFLSPFARMGFGETRANDINMKAVRNFVKNFKTVGNNEWFASADGGFTSTFVSDGINTTVSYDSKGRLQHIIKIYGENRLSFDLRHLVKREYYDASITLVKEVETDSGVITYVHMQDKDSWKIVRIVDGQMQLVEILNKS
jgi:hypothetical protein